MDMILEFEKDLAYLVTTAGNGKVYTRSGREVMITNFNGTTKRNRPIEGKIRIGKDSWSTKKYWSEEGKMNGGAIHNFDLHIGVKDDDFWD